MPLNDLTEGFMRGYGFGMNVQAANENRKRQQVYDQQREELFNIQKTLGQIGIDNALDDNWRRKQLRAYDQIGGVLEQAKALRAQGKNDEADNLLRSPNLLDPVNQVMSNDINQGGPDGHDKRITDLYPAPDGKNMYAELEMTPREGVEGKTYRAPMTTGRQPTDRQLMKISPMEMYQRFGSEAKALMWVERQRARLGDPVALKQMLEQNKPQNLGPGHSLVTVDDSGKPNVIYTNPNRPDGKSPRDYQQIQVHKYVMEQFKVGAQEAWDIMNESKSNPQELATKMYFNALKERDQNFRPGAKGWEDDEAIKQRVINAVQTMTKQLGRGGARRPSAPAPKAEEPQGADRLGVGPGFGVGGNERRGSSILSGPDALGHLKKGGAQPQAKAPYPDGTRLRDKQGKEYVVKNGVPEPVDQTDDTDSNTEE